MKANKVFFPTKQEAKEFAELAAKEIQGYVKTKPVAVNVTGFNTPPEFAPISGQINALEVIDKYFQCVEYVGYWND